MITKKNQKFISRVLVICATFSFCLTVSGSNLSGTKGISFLKLGSDARGNSLAGSHISEVSGIDSLYWNPAGLVGLDGKNLAATYFSWPGDMSYLNVGCGMPLPVVPAKMAVSITYFSMGKLDQTPSDIDSLGQWTSYDLAINAGLAAHLGGLNIGGVARFISQKLFDYRSTGLLLDAGTQIGSEMFKIGVDIKNIGFVSQFSMQEIPLSLQAGMSLKLGNTKNNIIFMMTGNIGDQSLLCLGAEAKIIDIVFVRTGYKYDLSGESQALLNGLTAGLGLNFVLAKTAKMSADIAWVSLGDLGNSIQFSLSAKL